MLLNAKALTVKGNFKHLIEFGLLAICLSVSCETLICIAFAIKALCVAVVERGVAMLNRKNEKDSRCHDN